MCTVGIVAAGLCATWYLISMPLLLRLMREHPARRTNTEGKGKCVLTVSELWAQFVSLFTKYTSTRDSPRTLPSHPTSISLAPESALLASIRLPRVRSALIHTHLR